MKTSRKKYIFIFIFLFLTIFFAPPPKGNIKIKHFNNKEYISLYEFLKLFDVSNSFDIISGRGKIFHKGSFAVYQVGFSVMLINGKLKKSEYPITLDRGEILLPVVLFADIVNHFYPDFAVRRKGNFYYIKVKKKTSSKNEGASVAKDKKRTPGKSEKDRISFIIIDPGHGGKDPGATGAGKLKEKKITLDVSRYLEKYLRKRLKGIKIKLTRRKDTFIELAKRTEVANRLLKWNDNGIFVSIHVNASISKKISGFETYFLSQNPSNEDARTTAALENNVVVLEDKSGKDSYRDVDHIQALMLTTQIQKESSMLAKAIQSDLDKKIWESKSKGVKKADFFVLRGALVPAVLVEIGFISNKKESANLRRKKYQKRVAEGIGNGIVDFIRKYNRNIKK